MLRARVVLRLLNTALVLAAIVGAFALYGLKHGTRALDQQVREQERRLDRLHGDIAVLKAERAHLARPERIEALARAAGYAPISARQWIDLDGMELPAHSAGPASIISDFRR